MSDPTGINELVSARLKRIKFRNQGLADTEAKYHLETLDRILKRIKAGKEDESMLIQYAQTITDFSQLLQITMTNKIPREDFKQAFDDGKITLIQFFNN